ncbi:MAG: YcnI family protein [Actinomycetota bacterium]
MPTSTIRPRTVAAGVGATIAAAALVLLAPTAASAHVHVTPSSTEAGSTSELAFSFGHGCDGSPTTGVAVTIPEEIAAVGLIANPGWEVAVDTAGGAAGDPRVVRFTADEPLPDGIRETLELEVTLPDGVADGTELAFPALQTCEVGETDWSSVDQEADAPAPILTIGEAAEHGHGASADTDAEDAASAVGSAASVDATSAAMPIAIAALVVAILAAALAAFAALRRRATD